MRLQEREGQNFQAVYAFVRRIAGPTPPSAAALEEWRARINAALAGVTIRDQMSRQLQQRYEETLNGK
jgi:hypothetical protein